VEMSDTGWLALIHEVTELKLEIFNNERKDNLTYAKPMLLLNTDSDLMANMYIVLNYRRKLLEHAYGYYGMELKLAFSSL
jgi:hypothetical protein